MSASLLYRIVAVLLLLFAAGHQVGFRQVDPRWGVAAPIDQLKATRFQVQGVTRTYWGFYSGFGFFVTVLLLFAAVLAWQLGGLSMDGLRSLALVEWAFAGTFLVVTLLSWRYFFTAPVVFSAGITLGLGLAAWRVGRG
ncbi:MAG TPA: hypothetical protein VFU23_10070, partial [Gemmatimonadales bacterium]|nr:hypothetical protein [Gemmatimonadales bacterium]